MPFEPRWVDGDADPSKGQLVIAALELHGGIVSGREGMDYTEAIKVGGEPKPWIVGARRLKSFLGKQEGKAVDCSGEEIRPLVRLLPI